MNQTKKGKTKTLVTVLVAVALVVTGCLALFSARAMPNPNGPVITSQNDTIQ